MHNVYIHIHIYSAYSIVKGSPKAQFWQKQILLFMGTSKTKAGNVSFRWGIDFLLRSFRELSDSKTLGLIISGKLSSESALWNDGDSWENSPKHKNSIFGVMVMVPTQDVLELDLTEEVDDRDGALKPLLGSLDPDGSGVRHLHRRHSRRSLCVGFHATTPDSNEQGWRAAASSAASLILGGDVGIGWGSGICSWLELASSS